MTVGELIKELEALEPLEEVYALNDYGFWAPINDIDTSGGTIYLWSEIDG